MNQRSISPNRDQSPSKPQDQFQFIQSALDDDEEESETVGRNTFLNQGCVGDESNDFYLSQLDSSIDQAVKQPRASMRDQNPLSNAETPNDRCSAQFASRELQTPPTRTALANMLNQADSQPAASAPLQITKLIKRS
jgi:hypothetical protein